MIFEKDICPLCSNEDTILLTRESPQEKRKPISETSCLLYFLRCEECGYEFVNSEISSYNFEVRERCRLEYEEQFK